MVTSLCCSKEQKENGWLYEMRDKKEIIYTLPVIAVGIILPLLVWPVRVRTYTEGEGWLPSAQYETDYFLWVKMVFLIACSVVMVVLLLMYVSKHAEDIWRNRKPRILFLGGYAVLVLLSSAFSENRLLSFRGVTGLFQGAVVVCCYLIVYLYCAVMAERLHTGLLTYAWLAGGTVFCVIGLSQLLGVDFLRLFIPETISVVESFRVYLTLFHWNYVGSYAALVLPLFAAIGFYFAGKGKRAACGISVTLFVLMAVCLIGSRSRSGLAALIIVGVAEGIRRRALIPARGRIILCLAVVCGLLAAGMFAVNGSRGESTGDLRGVQHNVKVREGVDYITTEWDGVYFGIDGERYVFRIRGEGEEIVPEIRDGKDCMTLKSPLSLVKETHEVDGVTVCGFSVLYREGKWFFTNQTEDGSYRYLTPQKTLDTMIRSHGALPKAFDRFASLRGYVWSRTLVLLPQTLILGKGADQFGFVFPNRDYAARYQYDISGVYYKKPHNWYLQMCVESGCVSAVLVIAYFMSLLTAAGRSERALDGRRKGCLVPALRCSVIAYLLTAFFNDSFLTVAPVFWCMVGLLEGNIQIDSIDEKS